MSPVHGNGTSTDGVVSWGRKDGKEFSPEVVRVFLVHSKAKRQGTAAHATHLAHADGGDGRADVLHRVVDGQPRRDDPTRRVDVHVAGLVGVLGLEEEQLRGHQGGHGLRGLILRCAVCGRSVGRGGERTPIDPRAPNTTSAPADSYSPP